MIPIKKIILRRGRVFDISEAFSVLFFIFSKAVEELRWSAENANFFVT